jgi:ribosomal protein L16 Arg81 hydroxylase
LYGLPRFETLLGQNGLPLAQIDVYNDGHLMRLQDMQRKSGKSGLDIVAESFRHGSTIRVRDMGRFDARLGQIEREVRRRFAAGADINLYLTPPSKAGFPPHFDITDVFIIQCLGRKQWRLYSEFANRKELPLPATNWEPERYMPIAASAKTIALSPGDVLYLPRGTMHEAFCLDEESMHLTVSIVPVTFAEVLGKVLEAAAESDRGLRERIPWSGDDRALAELVRERLRRLVDVDATAVLAAERSRLEQASPLPSALLQSAITELLGRVTA